MTINELEDFQKLAWRSMGKTRDETEDGRNHRDLEVALEERYGVTLDDFCQIAESLIPFSTTYKSIDTNITYRGYLDNKTRLSIFRERKLGSP